MDQRRPEVGVETGKYLGFLKPILRIGDEVLTF